LAIEELITKVENNPRMKGIDEATIRDKVQDAMGLIQAYELNSAVLGRATYLYACHLIFVDVLKHRDRFKSVKADDGEYTKFDDANTDDYWSEFKHLLSEQGYGQNQVQFL
jgi:hypothetical protein